VLSTLETFVSTPSLIPSAEPFFFAGGPIGCLLIHGFTGTPKEMRQMGEYLAAQGHTVLGIRLAAHATHPEDMLRVHWQDWMACVEDGWCLLNDALSHQNAEGKAIFVMGLSMGGVLALLVASQAYAARYPIAGVMAMSTPYALPRDPRLQFIHLIRFIQPRVTKGPPDWHNPEAPKSHVDYPFYPTIAIGELDKLLIEMRRALPSIRVPVLLVHSRQDNGVPPENLQAIYDHLDTPRKESLWVENSGHVITEEPQRERVFQATNAFIQSVRSAMD
jgi:carboxylesterase